jgi:hypothetical protein
MPAQHRNPRPSREGNVEEAHWGDKRESFGQWRRLLHYVPWLLIPIVSFSYTNNLHASVSRNSTYDFLFFESNETTAEPSPSSVNVSGGKSQYSAPTADSANVSAISSSSSSNHRMKSSVGSVNVTAVNRGGKHLLIAQYAAASSLSNGTYDNFLDTTSKINQAYAIAWRHDYLILRGIPFAGPDLNETFSLHWYVVDGERISQYEENIGHELQDPALSSAPESRATYNKVALLELALFDFDQKYDRLLILDADAMLYDFSRDIALLQPDTPVLLAHKTNHSDVPGTGSINVGVTLWNLRNARTPLIWQRWMYKCLNRIQQGKDDDDQAPLQDLLKHHLDQEKRDQVVYAVDKEFAYARGRFVKHFIRPDGTTWDNASVATRLDKMEKAATDVCARYHPICDQ